VLNLPEQVPSLWQDTAGVQPARPPLLQNITTDVAIIGGGFTGLATAHEIRRADPSVAVTVLEARSAGYGASGRNGAFAMTVVGLGFSATAMLRGNAFLQRAHRYMMTAVDDLDTLIRDHNFDCDCTRPGFLRVATTPAYERKLQKEVRLMQRLGFDDLFWLDANALRSRIVSPAYRGAMWEPRLLLVDPLKLVREDLRLAVLCGARVYENTPVLEIQRNRDKFQLRTPQGEIRCSRLVMATNAYSHLFPALKRKQIPAFTYMVATRPLTHAELDSIAWHGREGVEDARNLIHYYRLSPDNRLVMGGGPVGLTWGNTLSGDSNHRAWRHLERHIGRVFPSLANVPVTHRWGGPFSVTTNLTPAIGFMGDERAVFNLGCIGHGVAMSHRNARVIRDLILNRPIADIDCPFIQSHVLPWPSEPLRWAAVVSLRALLQAEDWMNETLLPANPTDERFEDLGANDR